MALALCGTQINEQGQELAQHGTPQFPIACYHDDLTIDPVPWHWHPELEIFTVSQGTAIAAAGAERFTVRQGEGMFINAGVLHAAWAEDGANCRFHSAVFHPLLVGGSRDSVFWSKYLQPLTAKGGRECVHFDGSEGWHTQAVRAIESTWHSCAEEPPGYEFQAREALSQLILLLTRRRAPDLPAKSEKVLRDEGRVKLMLEYIQRNCAGPLTTAAIAHAAAVSESECLRCFRSVIGLPPIQYVTQYRVQRAAELLLSSTLGIAEIGAKCGFQDASYFSKTFHGQKGCTPSEYRKRNLP